MEIFIWTNGDSSVGLTGDNAKVTIEGEYDVSDREFIRSELKNLFGELWASKTHVAFKEEIND